MRRLGLLMLAVVVPAIAVAAPVGVKLTQRGGEKSSSPDRKWTVESRKSGVAAAIWVTGPSRSPRQVTTYSDTADIWWQVSSARVLIVKHQSGVDRVEQYGLTGTVDRDQLDRYLEKNLDQRGPRLASINNRIITTSAGPGQIVCLKIVETGPSAKAPRGPAVSRNGVWQIYASGTPQRIGSCGGLAETITAT